MTETEWKIERHTAREWHPTIHERPKLTDEELTEFIQTSRLDWAGKCRYAEARGMSCGHPRGCLVQDGAGTAICAWCEEVAGLREELERAAKSEIALNTVPVKIHGTPCDTCGGTDWQCAECLEDIAEMTEGVSKIEWDEAARLRELIPDAGMLHRLTYAAELWGEGGSDLEQGDIAAGYALMEKIHLHHAGACMEPPDSIYFLSRSGHEEANVDET